MSWTQCVPELILDAIRIPGDLVQNQLQYPLEKLCLGMACVTLRLFLLQFLHYA